MSCARTHFALLPRCSVVIAACLSIFYGAVGGMTARADETWGTSLSWLMDPPSTETALDFSITSNGDTAADPPGTIHELPTQSPPAVGDDWTTERPTEPLIGNEYEWSGDWTWQWLPTGLIYRSYQAGPHEPRMAIVAFDEDGRTLWDPTLGGRVGLLRFGDCNALYPQGYQLDFYGAAISRLDVDHRQDLDSTDYVFGFPLTYGVENWQFKLGYAHLSSHLGDELARRVPGALANRINYVRDGFVLGASNFPIPACRVYGEVGWAFNSDGGAEPWETQWGTELSKPGPTGSSGTPFLAVNAHLQEEHDFGGSLAAQAGWLRRGNYGQTLRFGLHYLVGKSTQFQFYNNSEKQIGLGLWYDM